MKLHNISAGHAIELMGNYYSHNNTATTWELLQLAIEEDRRCRSRMRAQR